MILVGGLNCCGDVVVSGVNLGKTGDLLLDDIVQDIVRQRDLAQRASNKMALSTLTRMLREGIHTDIIINASKWEHQNSSCRAGLTVACLAEHVLNPWLFELHELKADCTTYLAKFEKVLDIRDDFAAFVQIADRELVAGIFMEVLNAWRGF
ncbi:hypothetical protein MLD38_034277 [Melastoma candidum]|uniref:Uncharacterized protein n=1 Tax=Melastoma candidum TaxID=119954 RepID=A0ACB9M9E1_9MYRT|nr:hypothetical protein MLD38_034277 [Melastoma candidum]